MCLQRQGSLFDDERIKQRQLDDVADRIKERFARGLSAGPHRYSVIEKRQGRHDKMTEENRESVSAMD